MEPTKNEKQNTSYAMERLEELANPTGPVGKTRNMKAIIAVMAVAVGGAGLTYMGHRQKQAKADMSVVADSTASLKQANILATGYDPSKDKPYEQTSMGLPGATMPGAAPGDSSPEQKLASLQEAARGRQGAPAGAGGNQAQNQGAQAQAMRQQQMSGRGGGGPATPASILPASLRVRLNPEYRQWMETQAAPSISWSKAEGASGVGGPPPVRQSAAGGVNIPGVDSSLQNLYANPQGGGSMGRPFYLPAGAEITCVTDHPINTDYPGSIRATVIGPSELKGSRVIVTQGGVNIDRAAASVKKLVVNRNNSWSEYNITGEIRTDLPALNGIVDHHYARKILPAVANAGLSGGALYLSSQDKSGKISTSDQIYNSMMVSGLSGIQSEIGKINEGKPEVTVVVPAGQEFNILLTAGMEVK